MLELNWNEEGGYTAPNQRVYPWRWLWDSCFHAILWARLDSSRAQRELQAVFTSQHRPSGFVPHVDYGVQPDYDRNLWGRPGTSILTQPPMYGHAIRVMTELGIEVPTDMMDDAWAGIRFFREHRTFQGMVTAVHPWEAGCDDTPRWDSWAHSPFSREGFRLIKGRLVGAVRLDDQGVPVGSSEFGVGSVALTALVVFNALELAAISPDVGVVDMVDPWLAGLEHHWDDELGLWVDGGPITRESGRVATLESFFPVLVDDRHWERVRDTICHPQRFGARYGPRQVDRRYPGYRGDEYWRGATFAPLNYLLWVAARRQGDMTWADALASTTLSGAIASNWAEYWNPDTGDGYGAIPQSWTGLASYMADP